VIISIMTHPRAQMSTLLVNKPSSCSGDMYLIVPQFAESVGLVRSKIFETPKSASFKVFISLLNRMFCGFKS